MGMTTGGQKRVRFTRGEKCTVCGGCEENDRGQGKRCFGFRVGGKVFCTREDHAGSIPFNTNASAYVHRAKGECPCGVEHAPGDPKPKEVRAYPYKDKAGVLRFEVVRFDPKDFRQRRVVGSRRIWGLGKGKDRVEPFLYRLPELVASSASETVWILEGEKDVDNLVAAALPLKLLATCNPMGALKWRPHYAESLRGHDVVIIADNDPPDAKFPEGKGRRHAEQVAASLVGKASSIKVLVLPQKDVSDFLAAGGTIDELRRMAAQAPEWSPPSTPTAAAAAPSASNRPADGERESQSEILLRLASDATLFHSAEARAFAAVPVNGHVENHEIRSTGFRRWLVRAFYEEQGRPPSSEALQSALGVLEAKATYDGPQEPVYVRVAAKDGACYLDLGDASWRVVEIRPDGWGIIDRSPVRFRRPAGLRELPTPERGGSIGDLAKFLNIQGDDLLLLEAWLTAAFRPTGPYPILAFMGEQGSAKSTTSRASRRLIDPHVSLLRSEPREPRDLMIAACNSWVVTIDNISTVQPWLSDGLCRLATGGGFATRALYTDSEETFLEAQRPVILNGIEDFVYRGDLVDRCLFLHLPAIPDASRKTEAEFWEDFDAAYPRLLGALLDAVAGGLERIPDVKLAGLPRMADFAVWGEAIGRHLGWEADKFLEAYKSNRKTANEGILEDSPVAQALKEFLLKHSALKGNAGKEWTGTCGELLEILSPLVSQEIRESKRWPKSPRGLTGVLRRLAPTLRIINIHLAFGRDANARHVTITRDIPRKEGGGPSQPSSASSPPTPEPQPYVNNGVANGAAHDGCHDGSNAQPASTVIDITATGVDRHGPSSDRHAQPLAAKAVGDRDDCDGSIPPLSGSTGTYESIDWRAHADERTF